jgi:flavin-dependent dehydrogenase
MRQSTDVFVIGGGPAGLAAAIAARKRGFDVIVADGAEPPIDKACGEGLMPDTIKVMNQLGIGVSGLDGFILDGIRFLDGSISVKAEFSAGQGMGVRRVTLHRHLVEQARKAGVTLRWKTSVTGLSDAGVILAGKTVAARWIIGADGIRSRVRRWAGLRLSHQGQLRYAFRRHYRVQPWSAYTEVHWGRNAQAYVTPVGRTDVCVVLISRNPRERYARLEAEFPQLADRLGSWGSAGDERGAVTLSHSLERVHRGRVALIGDASGSVDAITGEGLCLSFHQAAALADALESGNLSSYQAAHRRLARRPTLMGRLLLLLGSQPRVRHRAIHALAAHPDLFARLVAVHVGATSPGHLAGTAALLGWRFVVA